MLLQSNKDFPQLNTIPKIIAVDTETHPDMSIEGYSFAYVENKKIKSFYVPVGHTDLIDTKYKNIDRSCRWLKKLCFNRSVIFHNAQFDLEVLKKIGIKIDNYEDTMLMHYTLDTERRHGLKIIMGNEYGKNVVSYEEAKKQSVEVFFKYADNDARFTLFLYYKLRKELKKFPNSYALYKNVELPFVKVMQFINYEDNYIRINKKLLKKYCNIITDEIDILENILTNKLGRINFNSPKQLGERLEELGYKMEYTPSGNVSTNVKSMARLKKSDRKSVV